MGIRAILKGRDMHFGVALNTELLTKILTDENHHDGISQHIVGEKPDYFAPLRGDERFTALVERAKAAER